jgi:hypothetical protein
VSCGFLVLTSCLGAPFLRQGLRLKGRPYKICVYVARIDRQSVSPLMTRLLIASPHRYPDLARLWHRFVMRELVPSFTALQLDVEVNIFCDANAEQFEPRHFPNVRFTRSGPGMRDFMEFYDATLQAPCDFILFLDADTFVLDGQWAASYFSRFNDPRVAAVSFVPRAGEPAIFAVMCRVESYRALALPTLACRYEFPDMWPNGVNPQPGDVAARELTEAGKIVVNIGEEESLRHVVNFRSTTGVRSSREQTTFAAGYSIFWKMVVLFPELISAGYENLLLGCLYEALYHEAFAPDSAGTALGNSLTVAELRQALSEVGNTVPLDSLSRKFQESQGNILRLAEREGVELAIPEVFPHAGAEG